MSFFRAFGLLVVVSISVAGCDVTGESGYKAVNSDKTVDYGQGNRSKSLTELVAGIWVDPNGCDHWIIDDGVEGYLSQRLDRRGKPVCSGIAPPSTATGPFKGNQTIADPI